MNSSKEVIGKRSIFDRIILFVLMGLILLLIVFVIIETDFENFDEYELVELILCSLFIVGMSIFCIVMFKISPKDLIILDKEKNELELHCGYKIRQQRKSVFVKLEDIESVKYYKGELNHYIIFTTSRPACLGIMLKNGTFHPVICLNKPHAVEQLLQRLVFEYNNKEQ